MTSITTPFVITDEYLTAFPSLVRVYVHHWSEPGIFNPYSLLSDHAQLTIDDSAFDDLPQLETM
jgi:hypothetical protein